jgi:ergothioneine biosynthesis protein EgtB
MRDIKRSGVNAKQDLIDQFGDTRNHSVVMVESLTPEDMQIQAIAETSPTKWHLAHTSWFFETFVLKPFMQDYVAFDPTYEVLFNSYYHGVGEQFPRQHRGLVTRPTVALVFQYRQHVDSYINRLIEQCSDSNWVELHSLILLGINHEQQHQELILTDIKYNFFQNPAFPAFLERAHMKDISISSAPQTEKILDSLSWTTLDRGFYPVGFKSNTDIDKSYLSHDSSLRTAGMAQFCFDNEQPRHQAFIDGARIANRLVTNAEYLAFIQDGGYDNPLHWLDDGWSWKLDEQAQSPLYWVLQNGQWFHFTLYGLLPLDLNAPVKHVNYYEANAYATWAGKRLPSEFEWEAIASLSQEKQQMATCLELEPSSANAELLTVQQLFGQVWQWTQSSYHPYPGFRIKDGAVGEYNGKFMCNQFVLKGGSRLTPQGHIRSSYRNFFHPQAAWQYSGIRLAEDLTT